MKWLRKIPPVTKQLMIWAPLLVLFVYASGCRNGESARGDTEPELDAVDLILDWRPGAEHAFLSLAKERKIYRDYGINLTVIPGEGSSRTAAQVSAGGAEFGLCAGETALLAFAKGQDVRSLAVFYPNTPTTIVSLEKAAIIVPEDLYGKRLGYIQGSSAFRNYEAFAKKVGLDRSQIEEIAVTGALQELTQERPPIDAMVHFSYQFPLLLELQGVAANEIAVRDYGVNVYGMGLISSGKSLDQDRGLVERMVAATIEAYSEMLESPGAALEAFLRDYPEQDSTYAAAKIAWIDRFVGGRLNGVGSQDQAGWQATADYLLETGQIAESISNLTLFYNNSASTQ